MNVKTGSWGIRRYPTLEPWPSDLPVRTTTHNETSDGRRVINSKWVRGGCVLAAFLMAVSLFALAETVANVPLFPAPFDKVAHFVFYGTMAALLVHGVGLRWLIVPLILVPVIGAADEWHQSFIVGRDASFWDWMADEIGTVIAFYAYWKWQKARIRDEG